MRFSLRTLLLMFPALIVSYALAYGWVGTERYWGWHHPPWLNQIQPMKFAQEDIQKAGNPIFISEFNRWFQGKPIQRRSLQSFLQNYFYEPTDGWGNAFVCVALVEGNVPDPSIEKSSRDGFYSRGEDGVSKSNGNDPDDLNSWNSTTEYYQQLTSKRHQEHLRIQALWRTPWTFSFVLILWAVKRWLAGEPVDQQKSIDSI